MNWVLVYQILYGIAVAIICLYIIYDTRSNSKTLAYLLLIIFLPIIGIIVYFSLGINYRKRKMYSKKLNEDDQLATKFRSEIFEHSKQTFETSSPAVQTYKELSYMLAHGSRSALTSHNTVKLLINGENKFPEVFAALECAKNHIHIEYYIYDDDEVGRAIEKILLRKAAEGVEVRFIYDDFGSRSIRKHMVSRLRKGGVKAFPFSRIIFVSLANRLNYRNHRKIIVIDGCVAFVGGINVSDRYINHPHDTGRLFWRDTHLKIEGPGVHYLQYIFLCDWNFCAKDHLTTTQLFFPDNPRDPEGENKVVQIAASGPDSDEPDIMFSVLQAINLASQEILITTPYFIPGDSIIDALIVSALGGVKIKLLVPGVSDSAIVNTAAKSYYDDLLVAGVEIYLYKKGFVHAKTMVADRQVAIVGSANMDYRSFDLNFEVNAIVYDVDVANQLADVFYADLMDAEKIDPQQWRDRPLARQLLEKSARLVSPLL